MIKPIMTLMLTGFAGLHGLTLPEAQSALLSRNPEALSARLQVRTAKDQLAEARAAWHPSLSLFAGYSWTSDTQSIRMPPPIGTRTLGTNDKVETGADLSWPLFTGLSRYYTCAGASHEAEAQSLVAQAAENRLSFQLGMVYFAWELSRKQMDVQKALIAQITEMAVTVNNRLAAGMATTAQTADAKARLAAARVDFIGLQGRSDSLKWEILYLTQGTDTAFVPEEYSFPSGTAGVDSIRLSDTTRPELVALTLTEQALLDRKKAARSKHLPSVAGVIGYRYSNPGLDMGADAYRGYSIAGLQANWTLYDGFRAQAQARQLSERAEAAGLERKRLQSRFNADLERAKTALIRARLQQEAALASVKAATEAAANTKNAVDAGSAASLDYLDATSRLAQSRFLLEQSRFLIKSACLTLIYAEGRPIRF
ncbi:MAG: TolC family protein [Fibrobacterota bacterium]